MALTPIRSDRLQALPPFLFDEIDRKKRERIAAGGDVINLGVGDPDKPTPGFIVESMNRAMRDLVNQQYPAVGGGLKRFREAAARFMLERFGVKVDPMRHIVALLGSKDGIAHLPWAVTNPGDVVMLPDPAYPVYEIGTILAGARVHKLPVGRETGWKPVFDAAGGQVPREVLDRAKLMWVNYPSNPTAASADAAFYERVIEFCSPRGIVAASDLAYSEIYMEGGEFDPAAASPSGAPDRRPPSLWQARNASIEDTRAIEFHSLSKTFNMTGWRIGFAVGHAEVVGALNAIKSNVDSGTFNAIQIAGADALENFAHADVRAMRRLYRERRDAIVPALRAIGCEVDAPEAGFFIWARTPTGRDGEPMDSMAFAARLLDEADIVVVPGAGFSATGREYFRVALTVEAARMREAGARAGRLEW